MTATEASEWARPAPTGRGRRSDILLAVVLLAGMSVSTLLYSAIGFYDRPAPWWISAVLIVATTVPLVIRRRHPEIVAVVVGVAFMLTQLLQVPEVLVSNIGLFIAIYSVGAWSMRRRRATIVRAAIVTAMFLWLSLALVAQSSNPEMLARLPEGAGAFFALGLIQILINLLYFGGAWYFGDRSWHAARSRSTLEARTIELAAERERTAAQSIALERVRIARELHDVVAHHVSVMGIQAGAARRVLARDPLAATSALSSIETSARAAVDELHGLLSTLRADDQVDQVDERTTDAAPSTVGIEQIAHLVEDLQSAGIDVRYSIVGERRSVPPTTSATAYRVAQEATTNAVKHAGAGAAVDLRIRFLDDAVEVEATDDGLRAPASRDVDHGGLGLVGMRERVSAVGGTLELGPRARGGFLVRASLPTPNRGSPEHASP